MIRLYHVTCCLETFVYQQYGAFQRSDLDTTSTMLNPLANPKGVKIFCELCPKPAYFQCTECRVAYYWYVECITTPCVDCKVLEPGPISMSEYTVLLFVAIMNIFNMIFLLFMAKCALY